MSDVRSSYIRVEDQNQSALNLLFSVVNNPDQHRAQFSTKPFRERGLPESFFQPPTSSSPGSKSAATSSSSINQKNSPSVNANSHRQHAKNQHSLPNFPSPSTTLLRTIINNNHVQGHLRTVSDTAALDGQGTTMGSTNSSLSQISSQVSLLPLPDGWEERRTVDGQAYYIDHLTQVTTWIDPRPSHYTAFQSFCATLPLPDGYEQACDARGNIYFIDHINKQTCWDDPRPNYYRSVMTKRLDQPPSSAEVSLTPSSPIPTSSSSSSPFHSQQLQRTPQSHPSLTLSPSSSMAQLTTNSPPVVSPMHDPLNHKLSVIMNEQRVLQQRKEELERMEADVRKMLHERFGNGGSNSHSAADQSSIDSFINELLHHRRQNSEDSGVGEGRSSINRTPDALTSVDGVDESLLLNPADYATFPVHMELPVPETHHPVATLGDPQLKVKSAREHHQWVYQDNK